MLISPPLERLAGLEQDPAIRVYSGPGNRVLHLGMRIDVPPFSDYRVREAFDLAIDRQELIARALHGYGTPASQVVPPSIAGFNPEIRATPRTAGAPGPCSRRPGIPEASRHGSTARTTAT